MASTPTVNPANGNRNETTCVRRVLTAAVLIRLFVVLFGIASFCVVPSWDTSQDLNVSWKGRTATRTPLGVKAIRAFTNWDGVYFMHIAEHGYDNEKLHAFFPGLPITVTAIRHYLVEPLHLHYVLPRPVLLPVIAIAFTNVCHILAAVVLFKLTHRMFQNQSLSYTATIFFCLNPASVFHSAAYTESPFALFTFLGCLYLGNPREQPLSRSKLVLLTSSAMMQGGFFFSLASLFRSNGLLHIGFLMYRVLHTVLLRQGNRRSIFQAACDLLLLFPALLISSVLILSPYLMFQLFGYFKYCDRAPQYVNQLLLYLPASMEPDLLKQRQNGSMNWCVESEQNHRRLRTTVDALSASLQFGKPLLMAQRLWEVIQYAITAVPAHYQHIQRTYWGNEAFGYWETKQLPNFFLAGPMLWISLSATWSYFSTFKSALLFWIKTVILLPVSNLIDAGALRDTKTTERIASLQLLPFVVLNLAMTIFCLVFMHVQVVTRFLGSNPALYWWLAYQWSNSSRFRRWYSQYASLFVLLGTCLFVNYYPWT
eukprot:gb/GECG01000061.1/.p1 GENE.gb/GECG01000061.1/~~gb/GECG01000061.1/.p1  ORF type:complete len:540 (+),score=14.43 gb/GECG01000061.1/:1-1620(+)